jgi:hypothetical protein
MLQGDEDDPVSCSDTDEHRFNEDLVINCETGHSRNNELAPTS